MLKQFFLIFNVFLKKTFIKNFIKNFQKHFWNYRNELIGLGYRFSGASLLSLMTTLLN